jgi:hypothetical protein
LILCKFIGGKAYVKSQRYKKGRKEKAPENCQGKETGKAGKKE